MYLPAIPAVFCTLILHDGVGNQLLQLEALATLVRETGCRPVLGYFRHNNDRVVSYRPWGGHPSPVSAGWCDFVEEFECLPPGLWYRVAIWDERNMYKFDVDGPDDYLPLPSLYKPYTALNGYFFHHRYRTGDGLVRWRSELTESVTEQLRQLHDGCVTAVHVRLYYGGEPIQWFAEGRRQPQIEFYRRAVGLLPDECVPVVFSDKPLSDADAAELTGRGDARVAAEECPVRSVVAMQLAQHRVIASSTLSAYAAVRQTDAGSLTVVWGGFRHVHGAKFFDPGDLRVIVLPE